MSTSETMTIMIPAPDQNSAYKIGFLVLSSIQRELSGPRSGRWYPMPGNMAYDRMTPKKLRASNYWVKFIGAKSRHEIVGAAYQASAPGEPPAVRTGRLRQSFYLVVDPDSGGGGYVAKIRTNVYYADDLNYGTERIAARPFVEPAIDKVMPEIVRVLGEAAFVRVEVER
jgi:hypothetical protein